MFIVKHVEAFIRRKVDGKITREQISGASGKVVLLFILTILTRLHRLEYLAITCAVPGLRLSSKDFVDILTKRLVEQNWLQDYLFKARYIFRPAPGCILQTLLDFG